MRAQLTTFCIAVVLLSGCAVQYTGSDGKPRVFGFADFELTEPESADAGKAVGYQTVGLSLSTENSRNTVTLGYSETRIAVLRDHSLVLGNPLDIECQTSAACRERHRQHHLSRFQSPYDLAQSPETPSHGGEFKK